MNTRSFIFFTRILARAQISSLTSEGFFIEVLSVTILETTKTLRGNGWGRKQFYRSQFWRLQKPWTTRVSNPVCFIGHNFGDYKNRANSLPVPVSVLSVTILETTKTCRFPCICWFQFYRSQFWRLQKPVCSFNFSSKRFIGHNFGDYKNQKNTKQLKNKVLSVTILETTKTDPAESRDD